MASTYDRLASVTDGVSTVPYGTRSSAAAEKPRRNITTYDNATVIIVSQMGNSVWKV